MEREMERVDHRPWVERHRPLLLEDVVAHEEILSTLRRLMDAGNLPHLLFYGPPGTGKTTTILACCRHFFGVRLKGNVLEVNASDDRGIDVVRNQIKDFASTGQVFAQTPGAIKFVVLDEADQMTSESQAALRRIIEKHTKTVRFCVICNHVNRIAPAIQSRCTRFRFGPVKKAQMIPRLLTIVEKERVKATEGGLAAAFRLCNGDMRRCLNTMQAAALAFNEITEETVHRATGNPTPADVQHVIQLMVSTEFQHAWKAISEFVIAKGLSVVDLVREIHLYVVRMDLPQDCKCFCLMKLADVEYYLSSGISEPTALAAVIGAMQLVRESIAHKKPISEFTK